MTAPINEYWPEILREIRQLEELNVINPELAILWPAADALMDDQFIRTATGTGIGRWERMLNITPFIEDDLATRRFRVLTRWYDKLPYVYRVLKNKLTQLFGDDYKLELLADDYTLKVEVSTFNWNTFDQVTTDFRRMLPANMVLQSMLVQRLKAPTYYVSALMTGEEITVYPWAPVELSVKGTINIALASTANIDTTTLYPKGG
ncbi:putative phage tail protein [Desulfotomaculum sp. 1211_IL3151]|uniref:putative phage tail protein n=1 Tax=Desulfotomaculum sp. 1211_IL3151 TaxID=3084055 RepID=UPI002FDB2149